MMKVRLSRAVLLVCTLRGSFADNYGPNYRKPRASRKQRRHSNRHEWDASHHSAPNLVRNDQPRDILEGSFDALQSLFLGSLVSVSTFIGILAASVALVVSNVQGSTESDNSNDSNVTAIQEIQQTLRTIVGPAVLGLGAGIILGSISTCSIALYSTYKAVAALWQGLWKTPLSLRSWIVQQKTWNPYERTWKDKDLTLQDERSELLLWIEHEEASQRKLQVVDTTLYDRLGISPQASRSDIKKAYFAKAKEIHPDKNREDPNAHERFVELQKAYSVLSDSTKRHEYDQWGLFSSGEETNGENLFSMEFDANLFVAVLFSDGISAKSLHFSPTVENYVGELGIANFVDKAVKWLRGAWIISEHYHNQGGNDDDSFVHRIQQFADEWEDTVFRGDETKRAKRSVDIAIYLVERTRKSLSSECLLARESSCEEDFRRDIREEAQQILKDSGFYGSTYLEIIGSSLLLETSRSLIPRRVRQRFQKWVSRKQFAQILYHLWRSRPLLLEDDNDYYEQASQVILPDILELITLYNRMDISKALREAIWKLMRDPGVLMSHTKGTLRRAIHIIGEEFQAMAEHSKKDLDPDAETVNANQFKSNFILASQMASSQ